MKRGIGGIGVAILIGGCSLKVPEYAVCQQKGSYAPPFVCCKEELSGFGKALSTKLERETIADSFAVSQLWFRLEGETKLLLRWLGIKPPSHFWEKFRQFVTTRSKKVGEWEREGLYYSQFRLSKKELRHFLERELKLDFRKREVAELFEELY
ncbi:MAG: hypothetical protein ABGW77_02295 [Campylobacterales bacterium]